MSWERKEEVLSMRGELGKVPDPAEDNPSKLPGPSSKEGMLCKQNRQG